MGNFEPAQTQVTEGKVVQGLITALYDAGDDKGLVSPIYGDGAIALYGGASPLTLALSPTVAADFSPGFTSTVHSIATALRSYPLTSHLHARTQRRYQHRAAVAMVNGPLLVIDQQGERSNQVQIGAGHDEILAVQDGSVRVVAKGLTVTCCGLGGLAPSPRGRYIAFSQEPKGQDKPPTEGLWLVSANGTGRRRLLLPPPFARLRNPDRYGDPLSIAPVAWSPDRYTLAYAVDLFTDTPINPDFAHSTGIWLTRYDKPAPRQVFKLASLATAAPSLNAACHGAILTITALSWAPDRRTVVASADCILPGVGPLQVVQAIVAVDTMTGKGRVLVMPGCDAAVAPLTGRIAYVSGSLDIHGKGRTTLWVADAQGQHGRPLVIGQGVQGQIGSPTWSPDERSIAYIMGQVANKSTTAIRVVDVATGRSRTVLAADAPGLPSGGYFVRLAWMHTPL